MPRSNAAEAWPKKDEDIEELPQDLLKEEPTPPPLPKSETEKALDMVRDLNETREDDEMRREREEASAAASADIKKTIEARDKAAAERARRALGAAPLHDLSDEAKLIEPPPIPSADKGWSERAAADIEAKKKAEGEEKRKNWPKWMKKLWDSLS